MLHTETRIVDEQGNDVPPGAKLASCRCLCKKGYVLGERCAEDGGTP